MEYIEFVEDIPFPKSNITVYQEIYYLEQWLRRILFTALVAKRGENWITYIDPEMMKQLKVMQKNLLKRNILDSENNSNLIWLTTFDQLRTIYLNEKIWPIIKKITIFNETEFYEKLDWLREIRNIIGHNRAVTEQTQKICESLVDYFRKGINVFRTKMGLFAGDQPNNIFDCDWSYPESEDGKKLQDYMLKQKIPTISIIQLTENDYFREISTDSPLEERESHFIDIAEVLKIFREYESFILATNIFLKGDAYGVIWSKKIPIERQLGIIQTFISSLPKLWIEIPYEKQSPRFLGDPKIWFYKDYTPEDTLPEVDEAMDKEIPQGDNIIPFPRNS